MVPHATTKDSTLKAGRDISFEGDDSIGLEIPVDINVNMDSEASDFVCAGLLHEQEPSDVAPLSDIWAHEYQMGPASYVDCLAANEANSQQLRIEWPPYSSSFSSQVDALKSILKAKWDGVGRGSESYSTL